MIYTIGYTRLTQDAIATIRASLGALLVDVRSSPFSRKPGFSRKALAARFADDYLFLGDHLGGRTTITAHGIETLRNAPRNLLLLCLEEAPGDCHRHHAICAPHFPEAVHIFQDELFTAGELARALLHPEDSAEGEYSVIGNLAAILAQTAQPAQFAT